MALLFNADEVFLVARQLERNGAAFYRLAGEQAGDASHARLFRDLAEMEDSHGRTFAEMQRALAAQGAKPAAWDPNDEAVRYLQAFVSGRVFDLRQPPAAFFESAPDMAAILKKAIEFERDSITFYVGIEAMGPQNLCGHSLDAVIRQEMEHVVLLTERLGAL